MTKLNALLRSLTLEDATAYHNAPEKWCFAADMLAEHGIEETLMRLDRLENELQSILDYEQLKAIRARAA